MTGIERPKGLTVLTGFYFIYGFFALASGVLAVGAVSGVFNQEMKSFLIIMGLSTLIFGAIYILLGVGCYTETKWFWKSAIGIAIISIIIGLIQVIIGPTYLGYRYEIIQQITDLAFILIINGIIIWYLIRENIKSYFNQN